MAQVVQHFDTENDSLPFAIEAGAKRISIHIEGNTNNDVALEWSDTGIVETFPENGSSIHPGDNRRYEAATLSATTYTRIIVRVEK